MAKKNKYKGMSKQEIDAIKLEKRLSFVLVIVFILIMAAGVMMARTDGCSDYSEEDTGIVSSSTAGYVSDCVIMK